MTRITTVVVEEVVVVVEEVVVEEVVVEEEVVEEEVVVVVSFSSSLFSLSKGSPTARTVINQGSPVCKGSRPTKEPGPTLNN